MTVYPQYRVSQWIDTSEESMNQPQATIIYGVQALSEKGGKWAHVYSGTSPMFFDSPDKASQACKALRATNPPKHRYWGAGEPDCPRGIDAARSGETT